MSQKKNAVITSPISTLVWPHLHAPDTKFDAAGIYGTKFQMPRADAQPIMDRIDAAMKQEQVDQQKLAKGKKVKLADAPYSIDVDGEGNETGTVTFNAKLKASGKTREGKPFTQSPALFDATGTPVKGLKVGGGSRARVAFEIAPFFTALVGAGATLRLKAVQVIELRQFGAQNASAFGFGAEEGFSATESGVAFPTEGEDDAALPGAAVEETEAQKNGDF